MEVAVLSARQEDKRQVRQVGEGTFFIKSFGLPQGGGLVKIAPPLLPCMNHQLGKVSQSDRHDPEGTLYH